MSRHQIQEVSNSEALSEKARNGEVRKRRRGAFTLVELVVVITILAILGTIGFLSIGGYSSRSRDSARVADVSLISKSLDLAIVTAGSYPMPDNSFSVVYSGGVVWYQGTVGNGVVQQLHTSIAGGGLDTRPVDPLKGTEYAYSSLAENKAYQIKAEYENDLGQTALENIVSTAYAAPGAPTIAYVRGNFGGLVAKTTTGSTTYLLAVPSILTNSGITAGATVNASALTGTLVFNGKNLTGASSFNPGTMVYSLPTLPKDDTNGQATAIANALKAAYNGTDVASNSAVATLINTPAGSLSNFSVSILTTQLGVTPSGGGGNVTMSGSCTGLPANARFANGSTTYTATGASTLDATIAGYAMAPSATSCQWSCPTGLPIGGACACPSGATCETNGLKYVTAGTYTFTLSAPIIVGAVAVGGGGGGGYTWSSGGGGGGGLGWKNGIALAAGQSYTVVVGVGGASLGNAMNSGSEGGNSYFVNMTTVVGYGGGRGGANSTSASNGYGGGYLGDGGGRGGNGAYDGSWTRAGAGAGGYSGAGGDSGPSGGTAGNGGGGAAGGYYSSTYGTPGGGGVGLYGQGTSGAANGQYCGGLGGSGGGNGVGGESCGSPGSQAITGGFPGGGGGGSGTSYGGGLGGGGAVRIIWGTGRSFPSSAS